MSLPRAKSVKQLKRFKKLTGSDIGDKTSKIGGKAANLGHVGDATKRHITDYEGYIRKKEGHKKMNEMKHLKKFNENKEEEIKFSHVECPFCAGNIFLNEEGFEQCEDCGEIIGEEVNENLDLNLQETPSMKETKPDIKVKLFNGGYAGPEGKSLFGNTNPKEVKGQGNETLDLLRIGKHVTIGKNDYFIDKVENQKVTLRERIGGEIKEMSIKEFLKKSKPDEVHMTLTDEKTDDIVKFKEYKTNENMIPKPFPKVKCQECGEDVCDDLEYKIGHVQNKHFIKPSINDDLIKNAIKTCFP